jgi:ubiquinone/menaquinone biosynthesis C-methylase UbiE
MKKMSVNSLKNGVSVIQKMKIFYLTNENGKLKKYKPWLGDIFSFLYDQIMEKSIFPKKFRGDINKHFEILKNEYRNLRHSNILEIATGSGNIVYILNSNNKYTGIDISSGLLRKACLRFEKTGFKDFELYNASAEELPFSDQIFDFAICNLSLNFFNDINLFIRELKRVLKPGGTFFCSVPIPERKLPDSKIRGNLYSEKELKLIFEEYNFTYKSKPYINGALLYFSAILNESTRRTN